MAALAGELHPETPQKGVQRDLVNGNYEGYVQDQPVPSSPFLPQDPYTPVNQSRPAFIPSSTSSARISRDLESLRAHLPTRLSQYVGSRDGESEVDDGRSRSAWAKLEGRTPGQDDDEMPDDGEDPKTFSALSKRADRILNDAKKRLSLLEDNIKGARYTFPDPNTGPLYSPLESPLSKPRYAKLAPPSTDDTKRLSVSPRINFGAPRSAGPTIPAPSPRASMRHARNYSEPTASSPPETSIGSNMHTARRESMGPSSLRQTFAESRRSSTLAPVLEEVPSLKGKRSSQLIELRSEADVVRDRLSLVQERIRTAVEKRRSWQSSSNPLVLPNEVAVIREVETLRQSLRKQETVIGQLEEAERSSALNNGRARTAEWEGMMHDDFNDDDDDDDPFDVENRSDEDTDYRTVSEGPELEDIEADLDRPHEDRMDAFDYEHFIIHSVFNNSNVYGDRSPSITSSNSGSTERGEDVGYGHVYDGEEDLQMNGSDRNMSTTSFETARSFVNMSDSDSEEEDETELDDPVDLRHASPMQSAASRQASTVFESSEPATPPNERLEERDRTGSMQKQGPSGRPASMIFAALTDPAKAMRGVPGLDEEDETLMRSLAEAMRFACVQLQRNRSDAEIAVYWRSKLEEAKRLLSGESDMI